MALTACPLCGARFDQPFLERRGVPVHQHLRVTSAEAARSVPRGDLVLARCTACSFVANVAFDPALVSYSEDYSNTQICSPAFAAHADEMADRLLDAGGRGGSVVEIGCGDGSFLTRVVARGAATGTGFDTTYRGDPEPAPGLVFETAYLDPSERPGLRADAVVSRHVIEHLPHPLDLLHTAAAVAGDDGVVAVETPDLAWVLRHTVMHDLFYEHCSYFTAATLGDALARAGLGDHRVRPCFGGQYLWAEARAGHAEPTGDDEVAGLVERYREEERRRLEAARRRLDELAEAGTVAVWGAGAKGVTFCNLVDAEAERIACVIDINPLKQGAHVPGTGHPIVGLDALVERAVTDALVLNPNYLDECRRQGRERVPDLRLWSEDDGWR